MFVCLSVCLWTLQCPANYSSSFDAMGYPRPRLPYDLTEVINLIGERFEPKKYIFSLRSFSNQLYYLCQVIRKPKVPLGTPQHQNWRTSQPDIEVSTNKQTDTQTPAFIIQMRVEKKTQLLPIIINSEGFQGKRNRTFDRMIPSKNIKLMITNGLPSFTLVFFSKPFNLMISYMCLPFPCLQILTGRILLYITLLQNNLQLMVCTSITGTVIAKWFARNATQEEMIFNSKLLFSQCIFIRFFSV